MKNSYYDIDYHNVKIGLPLSIKVVENNVKFASFESMKLEPELNPARIQRLFSIFEDDGDFVNLKFLTTINMKEGGGKSDFYLNKIMEVSQEITPFINIFSDNIISVYVMKSEFQEMGDVLGVNLYVRIEKKEYTMDRVIDLFLQKALPEIKDCTDERLMIFLRNNFEIMHKEVVRSESDFNLLRESAGLNSENFVESLEITYST